MDFGGTPSPHVIVQDPATIKATVPGGKAGKVPVKVTTSAGTVTGGSITYVDAKNCWLFPTVGMCEGDATVREANINSYYNSTGKLTFLDQVKSIYNGASSSATVSADLTTLNFSNGMQMTAGTNLQAGSSGTLTNVARGTIPTLSANGAAQAAQNMIYGGNFTVRAVLPVVGAGIQTDSPGGIGGTMDVVVQEGVDVQNFRDGNKYDGRLSTFAWSCGDGRISHLQLHQSGSGIRLQNQTSMRAGFSLAEAMVTTTHHMTMQETMALEA